jgi:hypothetical protein
VVLSERPEAARVFGWISRPGPRARVAEPLLRALAHRGAAGIDRLQRTDPLRQRSWGQWTDGANALAVAPGSFSLRAERGNHRALSARGFRVDAEDLAMGREGRSRRRGARLRDPAQPRVVPGAGRPHCWVSLVGILG